MTFLLDDHPPRPVRRRRLPKPVGILIVLVVLVALLLAALLGGRALYRSVAAGPADYTGSGTGSVVVQVHAGDSAGAIATTLAGKQVVRSAGAFSDAASADDRSRSLQPGFYTLHEHMSGKAALALLLEPTARLRGRVTLPEGTPLTGALDKLAAGTQVSRAKYLAALANPGVLALPSYAGGKPEGFLFPATYDVEPGTQAVDVLTMLTARYADEATSLGIEDGARALGVSPYDVVKVASLVEAETPLDADRAKVARVIYNRLTKGMPLQLDSTINYLRSEKKARLSNADISVSSPYNTYQHKGLPPTPINSPGEKALGAALHPATGDYLFFITVDKQGHSLFTRSYDAFLAAKAKAQRDGVY